MSLRIHSGRLVDPASGVDERADLYIVDGHVAAIGAPPAGFAAAHQIDASGRVVCPGLIDLSARLREPGATHKATVASECAAAVAGGVTTVCCPPDTEPVVDTPAVVELIHQRAAAAGLARVEVLGALTHGLGGRELAAMGALAEAGCVAMDNGLAPIADTEVVRRAFEYATTLGLTVWVHPEDPWLAADRVVHEGSVSARLGLPGIPAIAETVAVARELHLAEATGARVHFCRLSTAAAAMMIRAAAERGLAVSADVAAHQLHLTDDDLDGFDSRCVVRPPLRTAADRDGLRTALAEGTIVAVCSDHQPHETDAKLDPLPQTAPGISALETLLPLTLMLVDNCDFELADAIARLTSGPAAVLGIERGTLAPGAVADVCVFDPEERWTLDEHALVSRGKNTPFVGRELRGRVHATVVGGEILFRRGAEPAK